MTEQEARIVWKAYKMGKVKDSEVGHELGTYFTKFNEEENEGKEVDTESFSWEDKCRHLV
jgi:hypothetical protein